MDLLPTEEQSEIVATIRSQLEADFSLNDLAGCDGDPSVVDPALWSRCAELGWFALGLPEAHGGVGYTLVEEALLFEELGAHCTPGPFLATVLGAHIAAAAGNAGLVAAITGGELQLAWAEAEPDGRHRIVDHGGAGAAVVVEPGSARIVDLDGVEPTPVASLDLLVPLAVADLPATSLAEVDDPTIALRATVLVAAELAGIARATAEQSTQYAMDREQFGRPVGSFQAVKHRCADMAVRADAATNLVHLAAIAVTDGLPDAAFQAEAARVLAADAALANAEVNVQNHGGIGFTREHTAHRFVTRAQVRSRTAGNHRDHLAALLAATAPA